MDIYFYYTGNTKAIMLQTSMQSNTYVVQLYIYALV